MSSSYVEISVGYGRYREEASDWYWYWDHVIQRSVRYGYLGLHVTVLVNGRNMLEFPLISVLFVESFCTG